MAYTPSSTYNTITDKTQIQWVSDGEDVNETVSNRPIENIADMVLTLRDESTNNAISTAIAMSIALG